MSFDPAKLAALQEAVAATGTDLTKPSSAGGDYTPPAAGVTRLRFVGYQELGVHTIKSALYGDKTKPRARFVFELSGPKHQPRTAEDGRLFPTLIAFEEVIGYNVKNGYMKLFNLMKDSVPGATNFLQLLGKPYRGVVVHKEGKPRPDGSKPIYVSLKDGTGFTIKDTTYEHPETGEAVTIKVDDPITPLSVFLWDYADLEQWDALFIDGRYDDGATKNKHQEKIKNANNFVGSAIYEALIAAGRDSELVPDSGGPAKPDEGTDPEGDESETPAAQSKPAQGAAKTVVKAKVATKALDAAAGDVDPLEGV